MCKVHLAGEEYVFPCYPLSNWQVPMLGEEARPLSVVFERFVPGEFAVQH